MPHQASELAFCRHAIVSPARWAFSECQPCTRTVSGPNVLHGSQRQHPGTVLVQNRKCYVSFSLWVPFPHPAMETISQSADPQGRRAFLTVGVVLSTQGLRYRCWVILYNTFLCHLTYDISSALISLVGVVCNFLKAQNLSDSLHHITLISGNIFLLLFNCEKLLCSQGS